jgi:flavin-dependent dehydrogenase
VLVEGATSEAGEEERPPSPCEVTEANANIVSGCEWVSCCVSVSSVPLVGEAASTFYRLTGGGLQSCRVA